MCRANDIIFSTLLDFLPYPFFIKDNWTASDIHEFQRLCELKLLVGVVDEYIDGILYLFLCDTSSDEDIYLHNALRLKGHAFICRENLPSKVRANICRGH